MGNYVRRCQLDHMIAYSRAAQIRYKMVEIAIKSDSKKRLHICYCIQKQMCNRSGAPPARRARPSQVRPL